MLTTSYSDMQRFRSCPRSWYWGSYRGLRPKAKQLTGALPFGARIHEALQLWEDTGGSAPIEAIWAVLMRYDYTRQADAGGFTDGLDKENKLGHAMLTGYVEWLDESGEGAQWETLSTETAYGDKLEFDSRLGEPIEILVRGKIDRRRRRKSDGAVFIDDYKTMGNFGEPALLALVTSPQGRLYMELEKKYGSEDSWVAGVVYTLLRKVLRSRTSKPPYYMRLAVPITQDDLWAYRQRVLGIIDEMSRAKMMLDNGADHLRVTPFHPSWQCATCPFKLPCQESHTRPLAAEQMLEDLYEVGDPFERYATTEVDSD